MNKMTSSRQRGMTMVEVLIVLGIAAVAIAGVVGLVDAARTTMEGEQNAAALRNFDADLRKFKLVRRSCGNTTPPTTSFGALGAALPTTGGAGVIAPLHATATNAMQRCENQMWETFTSAMRRPVDALDSEGLAAHDADAEDEWIISGGGESAIEIGWRLWPVAAGDWAGIVNGQTVATISHPCTPTPATNTGPAAIAAFGLRSMAVCDATRNKFETTQRGIYAMNCVEPAGAGAHFREGDAVLLACILDTSV